MDVIYTFSQPTDIEFVYYYGKYTAFHGENQKQGQLISETWRFGTYACSSGLLDIPANGFDLNIWYKRSNTLNKIGPFAPDPTIFNSTRRNAYCMSIGCDLAMQANTINKSCFSNGSIKLNISGGTEPYSFDWADILSVDPSDRENLLPARYSVTITDSKGCKAYGSYLISEECKPGCSALFSKCKPELTNLILGLNDKKCSKWEGTCDINSVIRRNGKVGLSTDNIPNGYNLAVGGGVVTDYVTVQLCGSFAWCDYVFSKDYSLRSLSEVSKYINVNKHLPNTPSAKEIEDSGGFELKGISLNHQEKIEEIYLHLISINKRVLTLKEQEQELEKENKKLRKKLFSKSNQNI
jgi:SprB repeat